MWRWWRWPRSTRGPEALAKYARASTASPAHRSFDELLARPDIDAVYVPLPISMHVEWTLRAIAAGKHVLCEKPMAANASEATRIAEAAAGTGLIVAEAMHFRYHPLVGACAASSLRGDRRAAVHRRQLLGLPAVRRLPLRLPHGRRRHHRHGLLSGGLRARRDRRGARGG
ncbi:MAG: Gfo/Idh/MocA family oxidoreductase [Sandaracinaceae bacterium]|nr:Gfo/Idh/MocA family oxidoreductase [Sandaracinaceae bacterium]